MMYFLLPKYVFWCLQLQMFNLVEGHTSLSWIMRLQIALDAARGLEYIHEHTKTHYVHRDVKSSNILLDGSFRAKVSTLQFIYYSFHFSDTGKHNCLCWWYFHFLLVDFRFWVGKTCWKNWWWRNYSNQSCWYIRLFGTRVSNCAFVGYCATLTILQLFALFYLCFLQILEWWPGHCKKWCVCVWCCSFRDHIGEGSHYTHWRHGDKKPWKTFTSISCKFFYCIF